MKRLAGLKTSEEILKMVNEKMKILQTIENRRGKIIGYLIRYNVSFKISLKGEMGRQGERRPWINFIQYFLLITLYLLVLSRALNRKQ